MSCCSTCSTAASSRQRQLLNWNRRKLSFGVLQPRIQLQHTLCKWSVSVSAEPAPPCVQQMQYLVPQGRANRDSDRYSLSICLCRKKCCKYLPSLQHSRSSSSQQSKEAGTSCKYQLWLGAAARSLLLCSKLYTTAALQPALQPPAASCRAKSMIAMFPTSTLKWRDGELS